MEALFKRITKMNNEDEGMGNRKSTDVSGILEDNTAENTTSALSNDGMKWTNGALKFISHLAYYCLTSPEPYQEPMKVQSKLQRTAWSWHTFAHKITLCLSISGSILQIAFILRDARENRFDISDGMDQFRVMNAILCITTNIFHLNISRHAWEIGSLSNGVLHTIYKTFPPVETKKTDLACGFLMLALLISLSNFIWIRIIVYFFRCDYHMFSGVLATCDWGLGMRILYAVLQSVYVIQQALPAAVTGSVIMLAVESCNMQFKCQRKMLASQELTPIEAGNWNFTYRCILLHSVRTHICFGHLVIPTFFLLAIIVLTTCNYIVLLPQAKLIARCLYGGVNVMYVGFLLLIVERATHFTTISTDLLALRKKMCARRHGYTFRVIRSLLPVRIYVGQFFHLTESVIPQMLDIVVNYTITLLLS